MRLAYAILAHRNPQQLARLVAALAGPETTFSIHIDRAVEQAPFGNALGGVANVYFVQKRLRAFLYSYHLIEATLQCFALALSHQADVIVVISGQDYPLRPAVEIHEFFRNHQSYQFIEHRLITEEFRKERIKYRYFNSMRPILAQRAMNKLARSLPRRCPDITFSGGSQWLSVTAPFARHLLDVLGQPTATSRFFRYTHIPDEMAIQTVAMNSPFASSIINDNLRYIRWQPAATHPDVFEEADFDELIASGKLLARKFDLNSSRRLLDRLDQHAHRAPG